MIEDTSGGSWVPVGVSKGLVVMMEMLRLWHVVAFDKVTGGLGGIDGPNTWKT